MAVSGPGLVNAIKNAIVDDKNISIK
jgi:hypothetical protein